MENNILLCITTYNQIAVTKQCLSYANKINCIDILVIDDCSNDGTIEWVSNRFDILTKINRKGLTDSWNKAFMRFKMQGYKYLIISNNDVLIPEGSIEVMKSDYPLVVPMTTEKGAGYVTKTQNIYNYYQDCPYNIDDPDNVQHIQDWLIQYNMFLKISAMTGFFMMFNRKIINYQREDGNLFDPKNINTGNDDDIIKRVPVMICADAFIYHFKGMSFNNQITGRNQI